ncbi:MAG: type I-U CRISPR-associated RAMP protein Csb1/Cas7u [Acidimicrobiales bacterium]
MSTKISAKLLLDAVSDNGFDSGIVAKSTVEPLGGPGAPVKPAVYAGGHYQKDKRWLGEGTNRQVVDAVVIDNVPSQANRLEAALERMAGQLGLPSIVLDLSTYPHLPPHVPTELSSFRFPHRNGDAYLRDSDLDGQAFIKTDIGGAIFNATPSNPDALVEWMPQALLFGFWQSHLGKKGPQTKLARSWVSEIVGYEPGSVDTHRLGLKGDPLNLTTADAIRYDENDIRVWEVIEGKGKAGSKSKDSLAEVGHGQVPVSGTDAPLGAVSFGSIEQVATVSFAGLRAITTGDPARNGPMRALLVALGLVAHVGAFGRGFTLRSGADLRPKDVTWTWLGESDDTELEVPTMDDVRQLFQDCVAEAEKVGLPVGSRWSSSPLRVEPNAALVKVLASTFPEFDL